VKSSILNREKIFGVIFIRALFFPSIPGIRRLSLLMRPEDVHAG